MTHLLLEALPLIHLSPQVEQLVSWPFVESICKRWGDSGSYRYHTKWIDGEESNVSHRLCDGASSRALALAVKTLQVTTHHTDAAIPKINIEHYRGVLL